MTGGRVATAETVVAATVGVVAATAGVVAAAVALGVAGTFGPLAIGVAVRAVAAAVGALVARAAAAAAGAGVAVALAAAGLVGATVGLAKTGTGTGAVACAAAGRTVLVARGASGVGIAAAPPRLNSASRANRTPTPISMSAPSHSHFSPSPPPRLRPGPDPRRPRGAARAGRRRPSATLGEYRPASSAARRAGCYKRFTTPTMLHDLSIHTSKARDFVDITDDVGRLVRASGIADGLCLVFSPHTTAAITLNENADPDVVTDLLRAYADLIGDEHRFAHAEGNSGAHALTSLVGPSITVPVQQARLVLGRWQAIYLCEFDGPRQRTVQVQLLGERGGIF